VFDEDFAVEVGDGDLVAGGDDEDLLEASSPVDRVLDFVQQEDAWDRMRTLVGGTLGNSVSACTVSLADCLK
jgi:hypothetical protein